MKGPVLVCGVASESPLAMAIEAAERLGVDCRVIDQRQLNGQKIEVGVGRGRVGARPNAREGGARRQMEAAGAELLDVSHHSLVTLRFRLAADAAAALQAALTEATAGRAGWLDAPA